VIIASDGALGQVDAVLRKINKWVETNAFPVELVKYAGGCSMTQSPNDVGAMHRILHACFNNPSYRYEDGPDLAGGDVAAFKALLKSSGMKPGSFKTYWMCLMHSADFLEKAFQPLYIKSAFKTAGIAPYNAKKILSVNPYFRRCTTPDAQFLVDSIPELAAAYEKHDRVREEDYEEILFKEGVGAMDNVPTKTTGKALGKMIASRQRFSRLDGEEFVETFTTIAKENEKKREEFKKRKQETIIASATSCNSGSSSSSAIAAPATGGKKRKHTTFADETTTATTTTATTTTTTNAAAATAATATTATTATDAGPPSKKKNKKRCANVGCATIIAGELVSQQWQGCGGKGCKKYFCGASAHCLASLELHRGVCGK
jgi:hypothetical protein